MSILAVFFLLLIIVLLLVGCSVYQAVKEVLGAILGGDKEKKYGNQS